MDNIAGLGAKLVVIVQNTGTLDQLYGKKIESFYSNCSLKLYFGDVGPDTTELLKRQLGDGQILMVAPSENASVANAHSHSIAEAHGHSTSQGGSKSQAIAEAKSRAMASNWNVSTSLSSADSSTWGEGDSRSMGASYTPALFLLTPRDKNFGTTLNKNRGGGRTNTLGNTNAKGGGITDTTSNTFTETESSSWQTSNSYTKTETIGDTETVTQGRTLTGSWHKKPLLEPHEFDQLFKSFGDEEIDHVCLLYTSPSPRD